MLRCEDNSIYTGITTDLNRRMDEHFNKSSKCAKYTLNHKAKKLEVAWQSDTRVLASKLEYYIKKLSKPEKESLIQNNNTLKDLLYNQIEHELYQKINL